MARQFAPHRRWWLLGLALLIIAIAIALWLVRRDSTSGATAVVTRGRIAQSIETTGTLQPVNTVTVRGSVSGRVALVAVQPGDHVEAGDILAQLDRQPFVEAVAAAQQNLAAAELAQTVANATPVAAGPLGNLSALQRVSSAENAAATAQAALDNTAIVSPISGMVLDVEAEQGQPYEAGAPAITVSQHDELKATIDLDEVDVPRVKLGATVELTVDAFPGTPIQGVIAAVSPTGSTHGGGTVFPATVTIAQFHGLAVRPGMSVSASVPATVIEDALLVPDGAIRTVGRRSFVTKIVNGHDQQVEVTTGLRANGQVQITSGDLQRGDRVHLGS